VRPLLRFAGYALLLVLAALGVALVAARFHDGPLGPLTGGPFRAGVVTAVPADWSFASDARTLELELPAEAGRAITTWLVVVDKKLYVPCGVASAKRWPHIVLRDGHVRVRLDGKIYPLEMKRVDSGESLTAAAAAVASKYKVPGEGFGTRDWIFALGER
jgi:hypothetical protein